ncbi:MAG: GNAT family N-acetyltransferase [Bacteroidetes bacterium]|nr:MAG: GNAT family N-acetyltransferase [Bacteroidota bacterium]
MTEGDLGRLPTEGPFLCIVNQLFEQWDARILRWVFEQKKLSVRLLSSKSDFEKPLLEAAQNNQPVALLVNFANTRWLEHPGKRRELNRIMKVVQKTGLPIIPLRLTASVHPVFTAGMNARLLKLNNTQPLPIHIRIGKIISNEEQNYFQKTSIFRKFIQSKIFALGTSLEVRPFFRFSLNKKPEAPEKIAQPIDNQLIEDEIKALTFDNLIASQSDFDIFVARAEQIPNTLLEIGRLREITFRSVGEGTQKSRDLDEFDLYYRQLIIWDRRHQQLVGGYRMGIGPEIFEQYGLEGFYVHSVFKIKPGLFPVMREAIELGRSYIIPEYQKKRLPLFLLWKGILYFLLKNPQYKYLYGPVSISKYYSQISKSLIVAFIRKHFFDPNLARHLRPRKPFKAKLDQVDIDLLMRHLNDDTRQLDNLIEDIEPNHFRMPVLIRQYLKLNARFISFNVDPNFSDCLDGFIVLDLRDVPYSVIESLKKEV